MNIRWNQSRSSVCVFTKKKMAAHMSCIIAGNKVKKKVSTVYRRIIHCNIYKNFFFLQQDIVLTLVSASNGSIGPNRNFVLSIQPNDNPHGTVQFSTSQYNVTEQNTNSVQYLTLARR